MSSSTPSSGVLNPAPVEHIPPTGGGSSQLPDVPAVRAVNIHDLPDEIVLIILAYVTPDHLVTCVSRVCRHWHTLHADPSLYRSLHVTRFEPSTHVALIVIKMAAWLKVMHVTNCVDTDHLLLNLGVNNALLERLTLKDCWGTLRSQNLSSRHLLGALGRCSRLRCLSLEGTGCDNSAVYNEFGATLPSLCEIDFGEVGSGFGTDAVAAITNHCARVEVLRLGASLYEKEQAGAVVAAFCDKFAASLRTVAVRSCAVWSDATLASLARCCRVAELEVGLASGVTDVGFRSLVRLPCLTDLAVWFAESVTERGWASFVGATDVRTRMTRLRLYSCWNVGDRVAALIAQSLQGLKRLEFHRCRSITLQGQHDVIRAISSQCRCEFV